MKNSSLIASILLLASFNIGATTQQDDFLKTKSFGKFSFIGCMIEIDQPSSYVYVHVGGTHVKTQSDNVTVVVNNERFSQGLNNKSDFVKEYVYRQNYCSFIR